MRRAAAPKGMMSCKTHVEILIGCGAWRPKAVFKKLEARLGDQMMEAGGQKLEARSQSPEAGGQKPEAGGQRMVARGWRQEV